LTKIDKKLKKIKLIGTDIDGVWTDAKMYYNENGDFMKAFSTYDGYGVKLLQKNNYLVCILTSEDSKIVLSRAKKLNIDEVYINENNKLNRMKYLCEKYKIKMSEVAYIGDDLNDLALLEKVGFSVLTRNSPIINQFKPDYITTRSGGEGAFRELSDLIIKVNL